MKPSRDLLWLGVWLWGGVTAGLGALVFSTLLWAGLTGALDAPLYIVISDNGAILGPMLGASALVWSWFFQLDFKRRQSGGAL